MLCEDGLEQQPFGDEAVERRQGRDGGRADQEAEAGHRQAVDQPAQPLQIALAARAVQHGAGAHEQQALEQRVVERVQQPGGERQRRARRQAVRGEAERQPQADIDRRPGSRPCCRPGAASGRSASGHRAAPSRPIARADDHHHRRPTTRRAGRRGRRAGGSRRRPRPWSSRRSSGPRHGSVPRRARAAARRAAAADPPWSRCRPGPGPGSGWRTGLRARAGGSRRSRRPLADRRAGRSRAAALPCRGRP